MQLRRLGKRAGSTGRAGRHWEKQHGHCLRPLVETPEPRVIPFKGLTAFAPGAWVINMEQPPQTIANSPKPYGMVYDLVQNQHIPAERAIIRKKAGLRAFQRHATVQLQPNDLTETPGTLPLGN
jgi:hypothetical protein